MISVKLPEPQFEGQTKTRLGNAEVKGQVESAVAEGLSRYLEEHPRTAAASSRSASPPPAPARPPARPATWSSARASSTARSPRQARRLLGARPRQSRALHRRGRLRRRLGQAGPRPPLPGHPAAAGQDPERREGARRQDARPRGDRRHHHGPRHQLRATSSTCPSCATTASSS